MQTLQMPQNRYGFRAYIPLKKPLRIENINTVS